MDLSKGLLLINSKIVLFYFFQTHCLSLNMYSMFVISLPAHPYFAFYPPPPPEKGGGRIGGNGVGNLSDKDMAKSSQDVPSSGINNLDK